MLLGILLLITVGALLFLSLKRSSIYPRWQVAAKRLLDILVSTVVLVVTMPFWIVIMLFIYFDSKGPVIFKQTRIGLNGQVFTIYKFRTMVQNAEQFFRPKDIDSGELDNFVFQQKEDPRITRSGRFLRKTSLDELPQLINIFIGNMSLVGPRPEVPDIVSLYTSEQRKRLSVLPGVTGLAQINGRSELNLGQTIAHDLDYVYNWNIWLDLKILWKTIFVVLKGKDAY